MFCNCGFSCHSRQIEQTNLQSPSKVENATAFESKLVSCVIDMALVTSKQKYLIELRNSAVSLVISLLEANYLGHEKV